MLTHETRRNDKRQAKRIERHQDGRRVTKRTPNKSLRHDGWVLDVFRF